MRILYLSAEAVPFAKVGGLGDIGGSLPKALAAMGHEVMVVMPAYAHIEAGQAGATATGRQLQVPVRSGWLPAGVFQSQLPGSGVPVYFIAEHNLFNRPSIYGYGDDAYRFAFFSRAALELARTLDWRPDVVHAHDWHTAPAVTWLATAGQSDPFWHKMPTVFSIHNLAHQGEVSWDIFDYLGLQTHSLQEEVYGQVNFMARGIYHATLVSTVSPTYAREIMTPSGGAGLDGLLRHRHYDLHGILNGIDQQAWDPGADDRLPHHFTAGDLSGRHANRRSLQEQLGLPPRDDAPLVAMITRLTWQKGLDITPHVLHLLLSGVAGEAQCVVLGTGEPAYENALRHLASYHQDKMTAYLDYHAGLAPLIYAGCDLFLMPSLFEPCGLGQMIAMRYGAIPVVRETGGLADTVQDGITGFTFYNYSSEAFWQALQRALFIYHHDRDNWLAIQQNGMAADFSWRRSAHGYVQLYEWAVARLASM